MNEELLGDINNIHGVAGGDVIIGNDASDVKENDNSGIRLSKSWQKMNIKTEPYRLPSSNTVKQTGYI